MSMIGGGAGLGGEVFHSSEMVNDLAEDRIEKEEHRREVREALSANPGFFRRHLNALLHRS